MYIDLLIVTSGVFVVTVAAWSFIRAGALSEKARNRAAVVKRLEVIRTRSPYWNSTAELNTSNEKLRRLR